MRITLGLSAAKPQFPTSSDFDATTVANVRAWYRASLGVTNVGGKASVWADQSGAGRDFSQGTASSRPTITASDANFSGRQVLTFDGADDFMQTSAFAGGPYAQPTTIYLVCRFGATTAFSYVFDSADGTGGTRQAILIDGTPQWYQFAGGSVTGGSIATSTTYVLAFVFDGASSAVYKSRYSTTDVAGNAGAGGLHSFTLGANYDTSATTFTGSVAEMIAYSGAHNAATRQTVMEALGTMYGVTVTA